MLLHRGFQASIVSEGCVLETFGASYDDPSRTASGWVASTVGKAFALRVHQFGTRTPFLASIEINGQSVTEGICRGGKRTTVPSNLLKYPSAVVADDFIFYNFSTSPSDSVLDGDDGDDVGLIRLELRRVSCVDNGDGNVYAVAYETGDVPESVPPCASFVWRYRTLQYLQERNIAPYTHQVFAGHAGPIHQPPLSSAGSWGPAAFENSALLFPAQPQLGQINASSVSSYSQPLFPAAASQEGEMDQDDMYNDAIVDAGAPQRSNSGSESLEPGSFVQNTRKGDAGLADHIDAWQHRMACSEDNDHVAAAYSQAERVPPLSRGPVVDDDMVSDTDVLALELEHDVERYTLERAILTRDQKRQQAQLRAAKVRDITRRFAPHTVSDEELLLDAIEDDADVHALGERHAAQRAELERNILLARQTREMDRLTTRKRRVRHKLFGYGPRVKREICEL